MKKQTDRTPAGAITDQQKQELVESGTLTLKSLKAKEKKLKKKLTRVKVLNGYAMTTDPEKWIEYNNR